MNYDKAIFTGASNERNRNITFIENDCNKNKAKNNGEDKGDANKHYKS